MSEIVGFVLRSFDRHKTAEFYEMLGLSAHERAHGGPLHYELTTISAGSVTEIYTKSNTFPCDALMVRVRCLSESLSKLKNVGVLPHHIISEMMAYVKDPDGRDVLLLEDQ